MAQARLDEQTGRAARAFLQRIGSRYDIVAAILFGSRARHTHQPDSDADVAVLPRGTPGAFVSTKLDMADSAYDVLLETGIRIQPLPIWEEEWALIQGDDLHALKALLPLHRGRVSTRSSPT